MRKNHYETAIIINAALDDEQIESILTRIQDRITTNGGVIDETEKWGRKRLAYMIDKHRVGFYIIYRFEAPSTLISDLERFLRLDESILRFLTIKLEKFAIEYFSQRKVMSEQQTETAPVEEAAAPVEEAPKAAEAPAAAEEENTTN
ncbi:MAG: 30S ribosomal protein S6 [Ignavibacteriaceae bacterium]|nr:30S ribosomal protein S6 [Ignavibacteriaceae bacterium]NUM71946.1 30S ribosomal protein S6 [Ignavibacteriaceae bacterium]